MKKRIFVPEKKFYTICPQCSCGRFIQKCRCAKICNCGRICKSCDSKNKLKKCKELGQGKMIANIVGKTFYRLKIIDHDHTNARGKAMFLCKCSCGNEKIIESHLLISGKTRSCGCLHRTCNGLSNTPTYYSYDCMKKRCYRPKNKAYKDYGAKGITVCQRWLDSFLNFYEDMGERPSGTSLDRIDGTGNYTPENCKWSTQKEQCRHQSHNHYFTYLGKTQSIAAWAEEYDIKYYCLRGRLTNYGWSIEEALEIKKRERRKK